jgi:hypothetical protein
MGAMATKKRTMSESHKAALAVGRNESRAVSRYLQALEAQRPKRGRKRSIDNVKARLEKIDRDLPTTDPLNALNMRQERVNLQREINAAEAKVDLRRLEDEFVKAAPGYSERKGITYSVWRDAGVPAAVLKRAGIGRGAA